MEPSAEEVKAAVFALLGESCLESRVTLCCVVLCYVMLYILILFMVTVVAASERLSHVCSSLALLFAGKIDCETITRKELTQDLESSHGE